MTATTPRPVYNPVRVAEDLAAKGWTINDLARAANVHAATIHRFLKGTVQTTKTAARIAAALGYSPRRYLTGVRCPEAR